jgi:hypothetical protein
MLIFACDNLPQYLPRFLKLRHRKARAHAIGAGVRVTAFYGKPERFIHRKPVHGANNA